MLDDEQSEDGDSLEYQKFVNSLFTSNDDLLSLPPIGEEGEEDEDEYVADDDKENEDGDDDDDDSEGDVDEADTAATAEKNDTSGVNNKQHNPPPMSPISFDYDDLDAELTSLLEEDMEAAVTTLCLNSVPKNSLPPPPHKVVSPTTTKNAKNNRTQSSSQQKQGQQPQTLQGAAVDGCNSNSGVGGAGGNTNMSAPSPLSMSSPTSKKVASPPQVTGQQMNRLCNLLQSHYQILLQQAVMAVRQGFIQKSSQNGGAANSTASRDYGAETAEDLAEIIDGAVGMLQDLDQNRKDAIRNSIQQLETKQSSSGGKRSLLSALTASSETTTDGGAKPPHQNQRLTRSAFTQMQSSTQTKAKTTFDIKGLQNLKETFSIIDQSMSSPEDMTMENGVGEACRKLLQEAGSNIQEALIPNKKDISANISHPKEFFGPMFAPPTNPDQELALRKNRNQFTAAEDNLVLRGVNLYGEKQWLLIADRYLPDRSVNVISQRYSKLCLMLYKAHGIFIDEDGNLETPRKSSKSGTGLDRSDDEALSKLKKVEPPAILNVHRWSLEEDLTLLKAVPYLGNMWAELSSRFIPHRDRGHLRKRYQVLERRVKATIQRAKKSGVNTSNAYSMPAQPKGCKTGNAAAPTARSLLPPPRPPPVPPSMPRSRKTNSKKIVKDVPETLSYPGQHLPPPQYVPRLALQPGKRMSNGAAGSGASLPPGAKGVGSGRKTPGYSLPMRPKTNGTQETTGNGNAGPVHPYLSGVIKGSKGSKIVRPADVQNNLRKNGANTKSVGDITKKKPAFSKKSKKSVGGKKNGASKARSKANSKANNMDLLIPAASSPELDKAATVEGSVKLENNSTRTGFEKLLNEGSNDWSQGPRLKKMMEETDTESLVASTIVNHLATGSVAHAERNSAERLPHLDFDNTTSSGLSFLNDPSDKFSSPLKAQRPSNSASIFSRVTEQTDKRGAPHEGTKKSKPVNGGGSLFDSSPPTPVQVPSTPSRTMTPSKASSHAFHLGSTTPIGLSGGFSPSKNCFSSPGFRGAFSPGGMMMSYSKDGASADNFEAMFEISDRSRQAFEAGVANNGSAKTGQPTSSAGPTPTPYLNQPLTPSQGYYRDAHSLNPIDLDVVSALNTLSNSPARQLSMKRPAPSSGAAPTLPKDESKKRGAGESKSFFARAIGGVRDKETKKRRV